MTRPLKPYRPNVVVRHDGSFEQHFTANVVALEDLGSATRFAFGEVAPLPGLPLDHGTPVHSLILHLPNAKGASPRSVAHVEFNDQGNEGALVESMELGLDYLRISVSGSLAAGRARLNSESEIFEDLVPSPDEQAAFKIERFDDLMLHAVHVKLQLEPDRLATIFARLAQGQSRGHLPTAAGLSTDQQVLADGGKVTVYLDADVFEGFTYGHCWARSLGLDAQTRVLEVIRAHYQQTMSILSSVDVSWCLAPDQRMAGPIVVAFSKRFEGAKELVEAALRTAGAQMMSSDHVLSDMRKAATGT